MMNAQMDQMIVVRMQSVVILQEVLLVSVMKDLLETERLVQVGRCGSILILTGWFLFTFPVGQFSS